MIQSTPNSFRRYVLTHRKRTPMQQLIINIRRSIERPMNGLELFLAGAAAGIGLAYMLFTAFTM